MSLGHHIFCTVKSCQDDNLLDRPAAETDDGSRTVDLHCALYSAYTFDTFSSYVPMNIYDDHIHDTYFKHKTKNLYFY